MLRALFDWVRYIKERLICRTCGYKSLFAISLIYHLKKAHNIKLTKKDLRFLLKYNFITRFIKMLVACVLIPPLFIIKLICYLFIILDEIL